MEKVRNHGLVISEIVTEGKEANYILGGFTKLKGEIINPSGDWRPYLPVKEPQNKRGIETQACTVYGTLNAIETLILFKTGVQVNYSDRYLANVAKKYGKLDPFSGADPHQIAELIRKIAGCLREDRLPWTDDIKTVNDYYGLLEQELTELIKEGPRWYEEWDFGHEWLFNGGTPQQKRSKVEEGLTKGAVCLSVVAWLYDEARKLYYKKQGEKDGHWTQCSFAPKDKYHVFDSYDGFEKELDPLYDFNIAKVYYLTPAQVKRDIIARIIAKIVDLMPFLSFLVKKRIEEIKKAPAIDPPTPKPSKIEAWAKAIEKEEGMFVGSRSFRNNNPGNLKKGIYTDGLGAVDEDNGNFLIFTDYKAGFSALCAFLTNACEGDYLRYKGTTLKQFTDFYANPPAGSRYAENVAKALGAPVDIPIAKLL